MIDSPPTRRRALAIVLLPTLLAAAGGCSILGIGFLPEQQPMGPRPDAPVLITPAGRDLTGKGAPQVYLAAEQTVPDFPLTSRAVHEVAERAMPAVVSIYAETPTPYRVSLPLIAGPRLFSLPGKALGSAFFIHPKGYLLSNNHVVQGAARIKAKTSDEKSYDLIVLARDPAIDVALLRVQTTGAEFAYLPLGDSAQVGVGDFVVAIGNPLGLGHTVTHGIISQTHRQIPGLDETPGRHIKFLQTDTAINPGSSGGPLITLTGAAIGINTAIVQGAQGIAFTVPTEQIREFIGQVLSGAGETEPAR